MPAAAVLVAAALISLALPQVAPAATAPSGAISCTDHDAGLLLPGDLLDCTVALTGGSEDATLNDVEVDLPMGTSRSSGGGPSSTSGHVIWTSLSLPAGSSQSLTFQVAVAGSVAPGSVLQLSGFMDYTTTSTSSQALLISTTKILSPYLSGSSLSCADTSGTDKILPGDTVQCSLALTNAGFPDPYTGLAAAVPLPSATAYVSGGNLSGGSILFDATALPDLASGAADPPQTFTLTIAPTTVAGTSIAPVATVTGSYDASPFSVRIVAPALVTDAGPAQLGNSTMVCRPSNGPAVFPGSGITCNVTIAPQKGFESITGATATIQLPAGTSIRGGGSVVSLPLGDVTAGNTSSASFELTVGNGVAPGTSIQVNGSLAATSVPSGGAVTQPVTAVPLTVAAPNANSADLSVSAVIDSPAGPVALTGTPTKGVVHLKVTLTNAGPASATQPVFVVTLPAGVTFEKFDDPAACGRDTLAKATCDQPDGTLAAGVGYSTGMTLDIAPLAPETGKRVIGLDASSLSPDPALPNSTSVTALVQVPASPRTPAKCTPRRSVSLRVAPPKGARWRTLSAKLGRHKLKVKRGKSAWTVRVPVPRGAKGRLTVKITGRTNRNNTVQATRRVAVCR